MIIHAPMEFHRTKSSGGTSPKGCIIPFLADGELPEKLKNGIFILSPEQIQEYAKICENIMTFLAGVEESEYFSQNTANQLAEFLSKLVTNDISSKHLVETSSSFEYRKVVSAMTEKTCENVTLSELGECCHISISYMKVLFEKYAGISPKKYYSNLRLQYIITLIKAGMSNKKIASLMNFSSMHCFSFFQKYDGHQCYGMPKKLESVRKFHSSVLIITCLCAYRRYDSCTMDCDNFCILSHFFEISILGVD